MLLARDAGLTSPQVVPTTEWISLYGTDITIDNELMPVGTIIRGTDPDGVFCGEFVVSVSGSFGLMPIYRDDPITNDVDEGAQPGDLINLYMNDYKLPFQIEWKQMGDVIDLSAMIKAMGIELLNLPKTFELSQNYPNPFNPVTTIKYQLPEVSEVSLKVYNVMGQEIKTLVSYNQEPGYYQVKWDGTNHSGQAVANGVYIYQLKASKFMKTNKMAILK